MSDAFEERKKALEEDYFRRQEQEVIAKMRAKIATEQTTAKTFSCPKCDGKLVEGDFENIKIDICDKCGGVWLDAGEMQQITKKSGWFGRLLG